MTKEPYFYQHLSQFQQLIGTSGNTDTLDAYCLSYLAHYNIDYVQQQHASHYEITRLSISPFNIVLHCWEPLHPPHKTLVINHGYFDHTGLYGNMIRWGLDHDYRVMSYDLPGHGLSSGEPGAIDHFDRYGDILETIITHIEQSFSQTTIDLVGQSTGGAVIANYLLQKAHAVINRCVLLAPLVRSHRWSILRWVYFACRLFLARIPRRFIDSSHNPVFNHFLAHNDPLQAKQIPLSWLGAMEQWSQCISNSSQLSPYNRPVTIIQGTDDHTVDWRYNITKFHRHFSQLDVIYIDQAKHQLVNESEPFWQQVDQQLQYALLKASP